MAPIGRATNMGSAVSADGTRIGWEGHGAGEPAIPERVNDLIAAFLILSPTDGTAA